MIFEALKTTNKFDPLEGGEMTAKKETEVASSLEDSDLGERLAGKYLTFKLANEEYGLEILKVQEIISCLFSNNLSG